MKPKQSSSSHFKTLPELQELEQLVGTFMQYWGFKKIHGRIWVHLYTSSVPLDSQSLMDRLKVSKGLMSLTIRDLLKFKVIEAVSTGKHGVTFFQASADIMAVIATVLKKRESVMMSSVAACLQRLTSKNKLDLEKAKLDLQKIQNVKEMTKSAQGLLNLFVMQACPPSNADNINIFSEFKFSSPKKKEIRC